MRSTLFERPISSAPFQQWLQQDRENRLLLKLSTVAIVLQFIVFKIFYPYPNFMPPDSYSYLDAAFNNDFINMWAIGYSKFLRIFSSFTSSHLALVSFQYLLLEASLLYFLFSIRYLLSPGRWAFRILLLLSVLNPLLPHIGNFVSSDCLFASLSLIWFTQLLWLLYLPHLRLLIHHAIILLLAFTVRYNALYYPFISTLIIIFSRQLPVWKKWMGVGSIILLLGAFIGRTEYDYVRRIGQSQFSAFGGWQMAANALYGYAYAASESPSAIPEQFRKLHILVNRHMDSIRHLAIRPDNEVGIYYLWDFNSPLRVYMEDQWGKRAKTVSHFKEWASMAPLYAGYGRFLIVHHPWQFAKYYLWPNLVRYYAPPEGFMGYYNLTRQDVDSIAVTWFKLKSNKIRSLFHDPEIEVTKPFPTIVAIINLSFISSFFAFISLSGFRRSSHYTKRMLVWMGIVWVSNTAFSVFSAPIELRYQIFPILTTLSFLVLLLSFIIGATKTAPPGQQVNPVSLG